MSSGRNQLLGMTGLHSSKAGKVVKTPLGFGAVTTIFADMARHFAGTWFDGISTQQDLISRAIRWKHSLSRFSEQVIVDAVAEIIVRGDVAAPSLETVRFLCQKKTDENACSNNRVAAKSARDKAMAKLRKEGLIHG